METEDPRVALTATDTKTRAAGARDLARSGTWADIEALVAVARSDKSAAVRMVAAGAAVDAAWRRRGAFGQEPLTEAQRAQLHAWLAPVDPGAQPGLIPLYAVLSDAVALARIGRCLRDPRNQARVGAMTALRRMALSAAADLGPIDAAVASWLDQRLPPDVVADLARVIGEAGLVVAGDRIARAAGATDATAAAIVEAAARLRGRHEPSAWTGLWIDAGVDVVEDTTTPRPGGWLVVDGGSAHVGGEARPFALHDGAARVGEAPARLVYAPRLGEGEGRFAAVQFDGRTFWRADEKDAAAWTDAQAAADVPAAVWRAVAATTPAPRIRGVAWVMAGEPARAIVDLAPLAESGRAKVEVWFWLGRARAAAGDTDGARTALDAYLDKAPRKAEWRKEAENLRAKLQP